jgi:glutamyl-tRNA synthetase
MGWDYPTAVQYGRLAMPGVMLSKTQTMLSIRSGKITGHDDVRLATVAALRRRGFLSATIRQVILDIGLTLVDASLSWENLFAHNRKFLDLVANRYFYVNSPVKLLVRGAPELREAHLRLNPSKPESGERVLPLAKEGDALVFHIPGEDASSLKVGDIFRLKDLMNVEVTKKGAIIESVFRGLEVSEVPKIHWVSAGSVPLEVIKPDASVDHGLAEPTVASLKVDDIVQFERYGFARIDAVRPKLVAVYAHR